MTIFMILIPPMYEHGIFFLFVCVFTDLFEQWFVAVLEEFLVSYSYIFDPFCGSCEWEFALDLAFFKSVIDVDECL